MTPDDVIALHKATERVISDMAVVQSVTADAPLDIEALPGLIATCAEAVTSLATVQRDLLAGMLGR